MKIDGADPVEGAHVCGCFVPVLKHDPLQLIAALKPLS
jgi:hypothetical protein